MNDPHWIAVGPLDSIPFDVLWPFSTENYAWILVRTEAGLSAFVDRCSHQDVKLSDFGELRQGLVICHAHGAAFRCDTGQELCFPAVAPLHKVALKIEDSQVFIQRASLQVP